MDRRGPAVALVAFLTALWLIGRRELTSGEGGWRPRLLTATSLASFALVGFFYGLPLFLAIDKVVPMGGTLFASDSLVNLIGYALGIATAVFAGIAVGISLGRVPSLARRVLTTLLLGIALVTQWAPLYQQLAGLKIVPRSSGNFQALLWIQNNAASILLVYAGVVVVAAVIALLVRRRNAPEDASAPSTAWCAPTGCPAAGCSAGPPPSASAWPSPTRWASRSPRPSRSCPPSSRRP